MRQRKDGQIDKLTFLVFLENLCWFHSLVKKCFYLVGAFTDFIIKIKGHLGSLKDVKFVRILVLCVSLGIFFFFAVFASLFAGFLFSDSFKTFANFFVDVLFHTELKEFVVNLIRKLERP